MCGLFATAVTTKDKRVDVSNLVVEKLPATPPNLIALANKLGFTVEDLKACGFDVKDDQ